MGKLLELKQRIRAVENIRTVTRTLATVAAARLSRTRRRAAGLRLYAQGVRELLFHQQEYLTRQGIRLGALSTLLKPREPVRNVTVLLVAADRGMCGGYNLEICRFGLGFWEQLRKRGCRVAFVVKGRKGARYFARRQAEVVHQEAWGREGVRTEDVERILGVLLDRYRSGEADAVYAVSTEFHSPIQRRPRAVRLLPAELPAERDPGLQREPVERWAYEPGLRELIDELLEVYLRVQVADVLLESYASEHGARMLTMEEATERADRALQGYRVQHNRLRREAITTDLLGALFAARAGEASGAAPARMPGGAA
jgi:F-type H+-transporting ATPase subunit gamma